MRSESMAWLFERVNIKCSLLAGGYKSYRNYLLEKVGNIPGLIVIEGYTGSGKTEILHALQHLGEQIIDLERLANHKGSVFEWPFFGFFIYYMYWKISQPLPEFDLEEEAAKNPRRELEE